LILKTTKKPQKNHKKCRTWIEVNSYEGKKSVIVIFLKFLICSSLSFLLSELKRPSILCALGSLMSLMYSLIVYVVLGMSHQVGRGSGVAFRAALQVPTDAMSFARPFLMMSCGFGGREGKKTMFYSVLSYLMGTQITRKGACKCAPSKLNIQPPIRGSAQGKAYGFWLRRGMGYGVWEVYGLCYAFPHEPTWWTQNAMGFERLWVFRGMG
jgi:hypothetical protein